MRTREQAIEKSYTAEQIDGLKRLFETHGMTVTGPPLVIEQSGEPVALTRFDRFEWGKSVIFGTSTPGS